MRKEFRNADGKVEYCDEVVESMWDHIKIRQGSLWGVVDEDYKEILPCIYEEVVVFPQGRMGAKQKEKWGLFDAKGIQIAPCIYDDMGIIYDDVFDGVGYIRVKLNGKWGLYEGDEEIVPCKYDSINAWLGRIYIEKEGKWGLANERGEQIIPCEYDDVNGEFYGDYVCVELGGKKGLVHEDGEMVLPCKYDYIEMQPDEYIVVCLGGKWGIVNEEGDEVVPCIYDSVVKVEEYPEEGYAEFEIDGKICRIYDKGEMYWD